MSDPFRLIGAVDAVQRVVSPRIKINAASPHRIGRTAFDIIRKRAEAPLLALGRRPARPFLFAADLGDAGPRLRLFADDHAVADRLVVRQHVVEVARVAIDHDGARGFLAVILDDGALVLGGDARLRVGGIREELLVTHGHARLGGRLKLRMHAAAEQKPGQQQR